MLDPEVADIWDPILPSHREAGAEVDLAGFLVVDQVVAVAMAENLAGGDQIGAVDHRQGFADTVVGDQYPQTTVAQVGDNLF